MFAAIGLLFSAFSTGLAMYSQAQQGKAAAKTAQYNAQLLEAEGKNREKEFAQGVARERSNQDRHLSAIRARLAGSGVLTTTGTPLDIFGDTASAFQLSVSDAARSTHIQQEALRQKQAMLRYEGSAARQASFMSALGTGLRGFSALGTQYQTHRYQGSL